MTHTIQMLRTDTACVITTPALIRRVLFGAKETDRRAVCCAGSTGWQWRWDDNGELVPDAIVKLIDREAMAERRRALATADLGDVAFLDVDRAPASD